LRKLAPKMEIIYCTRDLRESLLKVIASLNVAEVPLYSGYDDPQRYDFDFSIMKQSLNKGDSLIVTLEPEGYPKLCLKVYPNTISLFDEKSENGKTALNLFKKPLCMEVLEREKKIPPYQVVFSDGSFMYCIYNHIQGERLTKHLLEAIFYSGQKNNPTPIEEIKERFMIFHESFSKLGFFVGRGGARVGKFFWDNVTVDSEGHWWITDLNSVVPVVPPDVDRAYLRKIFDDDCLFFIGHAIRNEARRDT
jgi:hypothetical protein